jgi:hypothetical protein
MIRTMPRPLANALLLAAGGGLIAGCGGASTSSTNAAAVRASATIAKAQARAYAHAVNLRASDVPAMQSSSAEGEARQTSDAKRSSAEFVNCYGGVSPALRIAKIRSPEFSTGRAADSQTVQSAVEVWPSASLAARNNASYLGPRGRLCFKRFLRARDKQLNRQRAGKLEFGPLRVATVAYPLPGVSRAAITSIAETLVRDGRIRYRIYRNIFTFVRGPAEVELLATGFSRPLPTATEERLLLKLALRAHEGKP